MFDGPNKIDFQTETKLLICRLRPIKQRDITIKTSVPFSDLSLNEKLIESLSAQGFESATPIQELTIPVILEGKDLFAQAETGSGKTGSFAIPMLEMIHRSDDDQKIYIVLSPTRELAQQTHKVFTQLGEPLGIKSVCIIGGESSNKQKSAITKGAKIIVGTPGRVCDLIKQKSIESLKCKCVVFDEADRLFEMGFNKENEFVLRNVDPDRQLIMVSATKNQEIFRTAYKFKSNPEEVQLESGHLIVDKINQKIVMISEEEKMPYLVNLLRKNDDAYALVFCNTQYMTSLVALWLESMNFKVKSISGKLAQNKRTRLLQDFRDKKITILVCTDVAARGLDVKDVNLVVNYDLPNEAANYVHRIGRTGRAGKSGVTIGFCGPDDCENLDAITEYIGMGIPKADVEDDDFAKDITKRPRIDSRTLLPYPDREKRVSKQKRETKVTENKAPAPKKEVKVSERFLETSSFSFDDAEQKALNYFSIKDKTLLESQVIKKGKKRFILFGAQEISYQFKVKPIYRKILLPFLIDLMKKIGIRVYIKVHYRHPNIAVTLSGQDSGLLMKDKFKLNNAIKELSLNYLYNKFPMASDTKVLFTVESSKRKEGTRSNGKSGYGDRKNPRHRVKREIDESKLQKIADQAMNAALEKNEGVPIKKLNPAQRRIVHLYIEKKTDFTSTSIGDGHLKTVLIEQA
jgi:superfamily II DNA/RNA helicase